MKKTIFTTITLTIIGFSTGVFAQGSLDARVEYNLRQVTKTVVSPKQPSVKINADANKNKYDSERFDINGNLDTPNADYKISGTVRKGKTAQVKVEGCEEYRVEASANGPYKNYIGGGSTYEVYYDVTLQAYNTATGSKIQGSTVTKKVLDYTHNSKDF